MSSDPPRLEELRSIADFEALARERLEAMILAYYCGAAGDELTLARNTSSFDRIRLRELKARFALPPGLERENLAALSSEAATTGHRPLARGAAAVLVGRPILYGLAVGGAAGVARVLNILTSELRMAMALTGRRTVAEVDQEVLWDRA